MPYVDSSGNVVEGSRAGLFDWFWGLIAFITLFFKTLVNPSASKKGASYQTDPRDRFRNGGGGGGRWPGSGGPGGPGRGGGGGGGPQRRIGRLNQGSGASCPPMAGGG